METKSTPYPQKQQGAVTLLVTVLLLAIVTITTIYLAKVSLLETRTSANANRAKEALHHAQAGLDYGSMLYLDQGDSWADGTVTVVGLDNGTSVSVRGDIASDLLTITASGASLDITGNATVKEGYGRFPIVDFGELPPLMSNGNFPPGGTFSIVGNPNGGGTGVPVSAWVETSTTVGVASWQTCNMDEFLYQGGNAADTKVEQADGFVLCDDCRCQQADNTLCEAGDVSDPSECLDIVETSESAVPDVFENVFGICVTTACGASDDTPWQSFRDEFATLISCADFQALGAAAGDPFYEGGAKAGQLPLYWITGDCSIPANTQVASYEKPIILVVHGDLTMNSNSTFFGIMFAFSDVYPDPTAVGVETNDITINGSPTVYGVILVNSEVNLPTGSFTLVYAQNILERLSNNAGSIRYGVGRRAGSWTDFD
ncbi:hypothetical protein ACFVYJ_05650 [Pontibacter sp. JAM-7]|uniref:hypothetical protein n=1 Tax=Pontibacter sp. JAM-7 TaxID=3366581 RepID=UPI003AF9AFA6